MMKKIENSRVYDYQYKNTERLRNGTNIRSELLSSDQVKVGNKQKLLLLLGDEIAFDSQLPKLMNRVDVILGLNKKNK
ncbi:hypothetical protein K6Y31_20360 [Motilimonas cestriensis]|uniref:Uncharacterized protein n=1 Tax=Motilimonas cestriensis TaxID=2742685 RepID=A0ABS8WHL6_9GAMM|nr:hypothetical protein [Motilimonas cestriensis]MCE2597131.1 hypothetical protein [Motilimonas cestriensis]